MPELCHYDGHQESVHVGQALHLLSHLGQYFLDYIWSSTISSLEARDAPFDPALVCLVKQTSCDEAQQSVLSWVLWHTQVRRHTLKSENQHHGN